MAYTPISVCFLTSRPSESCHCRIPPSTPPKRCFPSGWNATGYTPPELPVSSTIVWSYSIVSIARSHFKAAAHRCSSTTSSLMVRNCRLGRVVEQGVLVSSWCANLFHRHVFLFSIWSDRTLPLVSGACSYCYVTFKLLRQPGKSSLYQRNLSSFPSVVSACLSTLRDSIYDKFIFRTRPTADIPRR